MLVGQMIVRKPRGKIQVLFQNSMVPIVCVGLSSLHQIKDLCEYLLSNVAFLSLHLIRCFEHKVKLIDRLIHPESPECTTQTGFSLKRPYRLRGRVMNQAKITYVVAVIRYDSNLKRYPISQFREVGCDPEAFSLFRDNQECLLEPLEIS